MIGFGSSHLDLECHVREFEDARLRRQRTVARLGYPVRPAARAWSPYFYLAIKSLALVEIFRIALDGGVLK